MAVATPPRTPILSTLTPLPAPILPPTPIKPATPRLTYSTAYKRPCLSYVHSALVGRSNSVYYNTAISRA